MRQFDFFVPNTSLTLGFTYEYFPYNFFGKYDNVLKGIYHEPWKIIAEKTGVIFSAQHGNYFDILDDITNEAILTTLDGIEKINETTKKFYSYSAPFYFSTMFAMFDPHAWGVLITFMIMAKFIGEVRKHFRRGYKELTRIPSMIYLLAILIVGCLHSAGFKGNTVITSLTLTSYTELVTDLRSGFRQLVLQPTLMNPLADGIDYMLTNKSKPVLGMDPTEYRIKQVCTNQEFVTRIFTLDLVVLQSVELPCTLDRIFIDDSPMGNNATHNEEFGIDLPYMIIFKRGAVTRRSIEMLNQILLRMFREEQISQQWTPRFLRTFAIKSEPSKQGKGLEYKPISVETYLHLLLLFLSLYLLSFLLLASEFSM
ncbi:hypothetical protein PMAYCL1PPCAC_30247, partial [Pristionchus mayeri]